jgi:sphingolipid delta-4 desaturase
MVAWSRLPQLYRTAPEFYRSLFAYQSYTRLVLKFIFDKEISPFSRWVRYDPVETRRAVKCALP